MTTTTQHTFFNNELNTNYTLNMLLFLLFCSDKSIKCKRLVAPVTACV